MCLPLDGIYGYGGWFCLHRDGLKGEGENKTKTHTAFLSLFSGEIKPFLYLVKMIVICWYIVQVIIILYLTLRYVCYSIL
jgi:hypothetical protein